jgi:hypothetical protein
MLRNDANGGGGITNTLLASSFMDKASYDEFLRARGVASLMSGAEVTVV